MTTGMVIRDGATCPSSFEETFCLRTKFSMSVILLAKDGSADFCCSMYAELAHSLCAKTIEVINRQIPDNTVLIVPG